MSEEPKSWLKRNLQPVIRRMIAENPDYDSLLTALDDAMRNGRTQNPLAMNSGEELVTSSGDPLMGVFGFDTEYNEYLLNAYIICFLLNKGNIGDVPDIVERYK